MKAVLVVQTTRDTPIGIEIHQQIRFDSPPTYPQRKPRLPFKENNFLSRSVSREGFLLEMMKYAVVILAVLIQGKPILVHFQSIVTLSLDEISLLTVRLLELY